MKDSPLTTLRREMLRATGVTRQPFFCKDCGSKFYIEMEAGADDDQTERVERCPNCGSKHIA